MSIYMLKRGQKKQPIEGSRREARGAVSVVVFETIVFEPGKAVETDMDLDQWIPSLLVKLQGPETKQAKAEPLPKLSVLEPKEDVVAESRDDDYEELADGGFRCLHCGKVLKAEARMIKHVENSH